MPDFLEIFQQQAPKYDVLVSREDHEGRLMPAVRSIVPLEGKRIIELGAGTGRVTRLLAPAARFITAFDSSAPMLEVARARMGELHLDNWRLDVADHRNLPAADRSADLVISGWSVCCLAAYGGATWREELHAGLREMERVAAPEGTIVIIETLGTGFESPHPPEELKEYHAELAQRGFASSWIRTDYKFATMAEAADLTTFFFGKDPLAALVAVPDGVMLPECTGIWWRTALDGGSG